MIIFRNLQTPTVINYDILSSKIFCFIRKQRCIIINLFRLCFSSCKYLGILKTRFLYIFMRVRCVVSYFPLSLSEDLVFRDLWALRRMRISAPRQTCRINWGAHPPKKVRGFNPPPPSSRWGGGVRFTFPGGPHLFPGRPREARDGFWPARKRSICHNVVHSRSRSRRLAVFLPVAYSSGWIPMAPLGSSEGETMIVIGCIEPIWYLFYHIPSIYCWIP